jgi:sugar phosphate permease
MYMITYMDRTGISIAVPSIAREFGFSQTAIGIVFSGAAVTVVPLNRIAEAP